MELANDIVHRQDVAFHTIWKRDFESVAEYGVLSHLLRRRLCQKSESHIYKAQKQSGMDLISIWDPWTFLKRHWRNHPLGSENRPWQVMDFRPDAHFVDPDEIEWVESLRDRDPPTRPWIGVSACENRLGRTRLNRIRQRIAVLTMSTGPAPGLSKTLVRKWIDELLVKTLSTAQDGEEEFCLVLSPSLRRYHYPGYKEFENFVRFRIPPRAILAIVGALPALNEATCRIAARRGLQVVPVNA